MKKYNVTVNGTMYEVVVEEADAASVSAPVAAPAAPVAAPAAPVAPAPKAAAPKAAPAPKAAAVAGNEGAEKVTAPMPGNVLEVKVSVGQSVKKGDTVIVLEAMKMENDIPAPRDGVIASVNVQKGATIASGDTIVTLN